MDESPLMHKFRHIPAPIRAAKILIKLSLMKEFLKGLPHLALTLSIYKMDLFHRDRYRHSLSLSTYNLVY